MQTEKFWHPRLDVDDKRCLHIMHIYQKNKLTWSRISAQTYRPILDTLNFFRGNSNRNRLCPTFCANLFVTDMLLRIKKFGNFQCSSQMMLRDLRLASPWSKPSRTSSCYTRKSFILSVTRRANESQFASLGKKMLYILLNGRKYAADCYICPFLLGNWLECKHARCYVSAAVCFYVTMSSTQVHAFCRYKSF